MVANRNGCEHTHTTCGTASGCNHRTVLDAVGVDADTYPKMGKIVFEQVKPNPSSKEAKRLKRSGRPF